MGDEKKIPKTPKLDELDKGPWPSFVREIKRAAATSPMGRGLLGVLPKLAVRDTQVIVKDRVFGKIFYRKFKRLHRLSRLVQLGVGRADFEVRVSVGFELGRFIVLLDSLWVLSGIKI
jgi:hypothetical protein